MGEREDHRQLSTLPVELKVHLGFRENPDYPEWLIHDEFVNVGGMEHGEWLPSRARVLRSGTRYEIGAVREDVEGMLALARVVDPQVQSYDNVRNFWQDHPKISAREEDGWLFIGANIDPTPRGFEEEYLPVSSAYEMALTAAIKHKTYEELKQDKWEGHRFRDIESTDRTGGRGYAMLFSTLEEELEHAIPEIRADKEPQITADTLADFPLEGNRLGLNFAPGKVIFSDKGFGVEGISVSVYHAKNGKPYVSLSGFDDVRDDDHGYFRLHLPIPDGVEIKTI